MQHEERKGTIQEAMLFRNKKLVLIRILKLLSPVPSKKRLMQSNPLKIIKMPKRSLTQVF